MTLATFTSFNQISYNNSLVSSFIRSLQSNHYHICLGVDRFEVVTDLELTQVLNWNKRIINFIMVEQYAS